MNMVRILQTVATDRGASIGLNTLRALARRGLVSLRVRTVRYPHRGPSVKEINVDAALTAAGLAAMKEV